MIRQVLFVDPTEVRPDDVQTGRALGVDGSAVSVEVLRPIVEYPPPFLVPTHPEAANISTAVADPPE